MIRANVQCKGFSDTDCRLQPIKYTFSNVLERKCQCGLPLKSCCNNIVMQLGGEGPLASLHVISSF